jgi:hypothetical protein
MEAKAAAMRRQNDLRAEQMSADIVLENQRKAFVTSESENSRQEAEAQAHKVRAVMDAPEKADPRVVQALAALGMQPGQLIAQAPSVRPVVASPFTRMIRAKTTQHAKDSTFTRVHGAGIGQGPHARPAHLGIGGH